MILGNKNPLVGKDEYYQVNDFLGTAFLDANTRYVWAIWRKQKNGSWMDITKDPPKMGQRVPFKFGEKVTGIEFKLEVYKASLKPIIQKWEAKKLGEIIVIPTSSKVAKIDKVVLFNQGAKDPNKADYRDTLVARAYCIALFGEEIEFQLWEDDAKGEGHNATINKNNTTGAVFKAVVNDKGIAERKISLSSNPEILKQIANKYLMSGDKNEGANHEYYVTASYHGKIQKASMVNVNVANPDNQKSPTSSKSQPKDNSAKFPATPASKTKKQPDKESKILDAYFVNDKNQKLASVTKGAHVQVQILSNNMIGKRVKYKVWEFDKTVNDEVYESGDILVKGDIITTNGFTINETIFKKGIDYEGTILGKDDPDKFSQNYFIEVIPMDISADSKKFGVNADGLMQVENKISPAKIEKKNEEKKTTTCICKEQYADLVWGGKVSCEFRKKVVEICLALWPNNYLAMADGLMAVMKVETSGSFKAQQLEGWKSTKDPNEMTIKDFWKDGKRESSRAVGLIQFTQDALQKNLKEYVSNSKLSKAEKFDELNMLKLSYAQMGEIKQLDKVKKYFENQKSSIKKPEDIYLAVFAPIGVGKSDDYVLYKSGTDDYDANASVDIKSKGKYKNDEKIQRSEILERFHASISEGKNNKTTHFNCGADTKKEEIKATDVVTYHIYADGKIEKHIPKQIKSGYEKKYKYVYHDDQNTEHEICMANWHTTTKKLPSKIKLRSKPVHAKVISDKNVSDGQTTRRVIYENGDIAEYGSNDGDTFWRLYSSITEKIELVEMPESVKYVKYSFSGTQRRYTGPNYFAAFLGALAKSQLTVVTTGSCFREGSCFPSQFHVNGESIDSIYFWNLKKDQLFVDSMRFFHYGEVKVGAFKGKHGKYFSSLKDVSDGGKLHNSHFHSEKFNVSKIKTIKE